MQSAWELRCEDLQEDVTSAIKTVSLMKQMQEETTNFSSCELSS